MIKIGVIGVGNRGKISQYLHRPKEGVEIVAAADINAFFLASFQTFFTSKLSLFTDPMELIRSSLVDVVLVFTPDFFHESQVIAALNEGKDVFVEKPLATTLAGCDNILQAVKTTRRKLYVGHNMRHMFFLQKMKNLIDEGQIGQVKAIWVRHFVGRGGDCFFKSWHAQREFSNSLLVHKGVHDFDAIHWLGGASTEVVQAMGGLTLYGEVLDSSPRKCSVNEDVLTKEGYPTEEQTWPPLSQKGLNPKLDVEDLSMVQMRLQNGVFASYQQCHYTPDYWRNFTVIGTEGRIENFGTRYNQSCIKLFNSRQYYNSDGDKVFSLPNEYQNGDSPDIRQMNDFLNFLMDKPTFLESSYSNPMAARDSVAVADRATASLRKGGVPMIVPISPTF